MNLDSVILSVGKQKKLPFSYLFFVIHYLLSMSHRESPVKSPVESQAEAPACAGDLTGEDVQRLLNMFLGSLTPKNENLVSIVRAPKGRVVVWL